MGARGAELLAPRAAGGAGGPAPCERARPPRTLPCPLSEAAGAVDGEGAPPGGPGAQTAEMRVNEKYSTIPAEDRSVHIINICAIEEAGYLQSEGTVSAGAATGAGGPRTCAAPGEGSAGSAGPRGARGACGTPTRARGAWLPAHRVCDPRIQSGDPPPPPPAQRGAPRSGAALRLFCAGCGVAFAPALARSPNWGPELVGAARVGVGEPPRWRRVAASRPHSTATLAAAEPLWPSTRQRLPHLPRVRGVPRARGRPGTGTPNAPGSGRALVVGTSFHPVRTPHPRPMLW